MSNHSLENFIRQPARVQFSVCELTQIAAALGTQIDRTSLRILLLGGPFVIFNAITLGLFAKTLGPIALALAKDVARRDEAMRLIAKINRLSVTGIDGRPATFLDAIKQTAKAGESK